MINEGNQIILYGQLYTNYTSEISFTNQFVHPKSGSIYSKGNEVIIPASGESSEDISIASSVTSQGIILGSDLNIVTPKSSLNNTFLALTLSHGNTKKRLSKYAQGKTIVHLHGSNFKKLSIKFPSIDEQKKIKDLICKVDSLVSLHQRKVNILLAIKKAYLSKIFPCKDNNTPGIRFYGFKEEWEQRKLSEISDKVREKNREFFYTEVLTNSAEFGIVSQESYFDKEIANAKNISGYYVVRPNDFVYNPRISKYAPVGPIKSNKLSRNGIMSPLYYVFRPKNISVPYLQQYFDSTYWHQFMQMNGDSGARADRFAIRDSVFTEMPIPYPTIEEQERIGFLLSKLDITIELHQSKLENLTKLKQVYLTKMFI